MTDSTHVPQNKISIHYCLTFFYEIIINLIGEGANDEEKLQDIAGGDQNEDDFFWDNVR